MGAEVVDFPGKTLCCGFPILMINETNAVKMVANHTSDAKDRGADAMVTPCPLCHLNLDGYQPQASAMHAQPIDLPILHLPQMLGLALGIEPKRMRLNSTSSPPRGCCPKSRSAPSPGRPTQNLPRTPIRGRTFSQPLRFHATRLYPAYIPLSKTRPEKSFKGFRIRC